MPDWISGMMWMMLFWAVLGLALLVAIVLAIVWLARRLTTGAARRQVDPAEEVLRRRYATGEIDRDEYERRLVDLRNQ
ncbi:MAG: SHOCT domain-containing protein [Streptosporangiales bacterium]|nr:SHOCT domain-containing protein [Streptosporangiales bacterium]